MEIKRTPEQFATDKPCVFCGAMDHEFMMVGGQKCTVCPKAPHDVTVIRIPENWFKDCEDVTVRPE